MTRDEAAARLAEIAAVTQAEYDEAVRSAGWDEALCRYRAPESALDMGRVFGSKRGTLIWVDAHGVAELFAAMQAMTGDSPPLADPQPGERFILCLSGPIVDPTDGTAWPRYLATWMRGPEDLCVSAIEGGDDADDRFLLVAIMLTYIAVNAALFPVLVSSRKTPRYDGERKRRTPPSVVTIQLRPRINPDASEAEAREYRHRWEVRGHWRLQACGPNRSERRRIWVEPHVKGPDGAPMLEHEKLYVL